MNSHSATRTEIRSYAATIPAASSATVDGAARVSLRPAIGDGADQSIEVILIASQGILPTDLTITASGDSHRDVVVPLPPSLQSPVSIVGSTGKGVDLVIRNKRQADVPVIIWYRGRAKTTTDTLATATIVAALPDGGARPVYYDRPGTPTFLSYEADSVAPAGQTTRATYTVPAGYKVFMEFCSLSIIRATAAAPVGNVYIDYTYQIAGAGTQARIVRIQFNDNTVGAHAEQSQGLAGVAVAGDVLRLVTQDGNTGGTISHRHYAKILPFVL